jgi:hypothetical protein
MHPGGRVRQALVATVVVLATLAVPLVRDATSSTTHPVGYWLVASDGGIFSYGKAGFRGAAGSLQLNKPIAGIAPTGSGQGYWLVASDGGIFSYGDATSRFFGSTGSIRLNAPIVGMAATATGNGYWLVASDGGIFSFGDAVRHFYGSMGGTPLNSAIVGMARTLTGNGYWLVAADGGIFSFGDAVAHFHGSMGGTRLNSPIVGMAATVGGDGYWLAAADGGMFSFGDAVPHFHGSMGGKRLNSPIVGIAATSTGDGYWLAAADGGIFNFGDAPFLGAMGGTRLNRPIVGMAAPGPITGTVPASAGDPVVLAAGDVARCSSSGDEATGSVVANHDGQVITLGDNAYEAGTASDFGNCYDPSWGPHRYRTRPAPGNHEFYTAGAAPYFAYFGDAAGPAGTGWYSFDVGAWHLISLNSDRCVLAGCLPGDAQVQWLDQDLAAHHNACTLVYWHHPLVSSVTGGDAEVAPLWDRAMAGGADLVLNGHAHVYERFAPKNGVRQIVVGTGGASHHALGTTAPGSEVRNADTYGVLALTLRSNSYEWQFLPEPGRSFTDAGGDVCH